MKRLLLNIKIICNAFLQRFNLEKFNKSAMKDAILHVENFYKSRMVELVEEKQFDDAHALFLEFVVNGKEPKKFQFIKFMH